MGKECPYCGTRSAIIKNITVDGQGATKAENVIAQVLACGHTVGGEDYDSFVTECHKLDVANKHALSSISKELQGKKAALWVSLTNPMEESEDATE